MKSRRSGDLEIGLDKGDHSRAELDGGRLLLLQDSLRIWGIE